MKIYAQTVVRWLKANLGPKCLAPCTGQDMPAIRAAVYIVELWCASDYEGRALAAEAFRAVVAAMQPGCRYLAFHATAHVADWGHRFELWNQAGLPSEWLAGAPDCAFAPRVCEGPVVEKACGQRVDKAGGSVGPTETASGHVLPAQEGRL